MGKKVIITEEAFYNIIGSALMEGVELTDAELDKKVKKSVSDAIKNDKDVKDNIEKEVKKIAAKSIQNLYKTLWQRSDFWKNAI